MKNRYIPFGYRLSEGVIVPHDREAEMVRLIFRQYISGESYGRIAAMLEKAGQPYSEGPSRWNKNMVGRILQNRKYTGQDGYPKLVTEDEFRQSALLQQAKYTRKDIHTAPEITALKRKVFCGECGSSYERILDNRTGEKWKCKNTRCRRTTKITDTLLTGQIISLLNLAVENPQRIEIPDIVSRCHDLEITRLTNEINRELDKTDCDEEYARILIMARAAAQYESCPDGLLPQKAREIKAAFESRKLLTQFDAELFECAVDAVVIQPDGTVSLKLKNGQSLENRPERRAIPW